MLLTTKPLLEPVSIKHTGNVLLTGMEAGSPGQGVSSAVFLWDICPWLADNHFLLSLPAIYGISGVPGSALISS